MKQQIKSILAEEYPNKEIRFTDQGNGDFYVQTLNRNTLVVKTTPDSFVDGDVIIRIENTIDSLKFNQEKSEGKNGDAVFDIN